MIDKAHFASCIDKASASGHAADILGENWYVAGGGNNTSGCTDLAALRLNCLEDALESRAPLVWEAAGHVNARSPVASEGLSLAALPMANCLLAFGGYNGRYHNSVEVYRPGVCKPEHAPLPPGSLNLSD